MTQVPYTRHVPRNTNNINLIIINNCNDYYYIIIGFTITHMAILCYNL